jgi:hypothetical protein
MRLMTDTDHTPRALIRLALPSGGQTTFADNAHDYEISETELETLHQRRLGYVETMGSAQRATNNSIKPGMRRRTT